ncbi:MAG: hypothetical protein H0W14_08785 [Actinobacteria bacterium]|nr:hypothetical protein [Actinomycetota bacterium]
MSSAPPEARERSNPPWRPSPGFAVPGRQGRPLDTFDRIDAETASDLARQLEHVAALNAQTRLLVRWMQWLLALEIILLAFVLVGPFLD